MKSCWSSLMFIAAIFTTPAVLAAGSLDGNIQQQALNIPAIVMFLAFVAATLAITWWASRRTRSAADYYAAGGNITGFQNGLAIAGGLYVRSVFPGDFRLSLSLRF